MILQDLPAERAILAGICKHGSNAYFDVADIIDANSFTIESNTAIYSCLKKIIEKDNSAGIDVPIILSVAKEIGLDGFFNQPRSFPLGFDHEVPSTS